MKILTIDPSVNNVGIALYDTQSSKLRTKLFHPKRDKDTPIYRVVREIYVATSLFLQEKKDTVDCLIVEYPNWQNSTKGLIAMQQGYTLDLAFIVGYLAGRFNLSSDKVHLPTPLQWKKNIPKAATERRVQRKFGPLSISEHEFDAVGLLMWFLNQ